MLGRGKIVHGAEYKVQSLKHRGGGALGSTSCLLGNKALFVMFILVSLLLFTTRGYAIVDSEVTAYQATASFSSEVPANSQHNDNPGAEHASDMSKLNAPDNDIEEAAVPIEAEAEVEALEEPAVMSSSYAVSSAGEGSVEQESIISDWNLKPVQVSLSGNSGAAVTSIPLAVPPGIKGVQPRLTLSYSSSAKNGWIGMGWNLDMGSIQRNTKRGLDYGADDYVVGPNELIRRSDWDAAAGGLECYGAKIEGAFTRYCKISDSAGWEVTSKDGTKSYYGTEADSRQEFGPDVFKWNIDEVIDTNGNYMTIQYTPEDQGEVYMKEIRYTGNGANLPRNKVLFHLESVRNDLPSSYVTSNKVVTSQRLKRVEMYANEQLVRKYELDYGVSQFVEQSLLTSVTQYSAAGNALPAIELQWNPENVNWGPFSEGFSDYGKSSYQENHILPLIHGDWNGDGRTDIGRVNYNGVTFYLSTENGFVREESLNLSDLGKHAYGDVFSYPIITGDWNGDGRTDLGRVGNDAMDFYVSSATGWVPINSLSAFSNIGCPCNHAWPLVSGDWNGDGRTDVGRVTDNGITFYVSTGTDWAPYSALNDFGKAAFGETSSFPLMTGDWNGDGKTDIGRVTPGNMSFYTSTGDGWAAYNPLNAFSAIGCPCNHAWPLISGDWNGDGKTDLGRVRDNGITFYVSTGNGWALYDSPNILGKINFPHTNEYPLISGDWNGDGKSDIARVGYNGMFFYISTGNGWNLSVVTLNDLGKNNYPQQNYPLITGDWNGDGKMEVGRVSESGMVFYTSTPSFVNLLYSVSNGIGATTTLDYKPSSEWTNMRLPFVVQTLSKVTVSDGNGLSTDTTYEYAGGNFDSEEREYRGFSYVIARAQDGTHTKTLYYNDDDNDILKGAAYESTTRDSVNGIYSKTINTYDDSVSPYSGVYWPQLIQKKDYVCDGLCNESNYETEALKAITDFSYDDFGNVITKYFHGNEKIMGDERTEHIDYYADGIVGEWMVSMPETTYVVDNDGYIVAQEWFAYYQGTGNLHTKETWNNEGSNPVVVYEQYDGYGNATQVRDPGGYVSTVSYDYKPTHLEVTATNALGHSGTKKYNYEFGSVFEEIDPNGIYTTYEYDEFGRVMNIYIPIEDPVNPVTKYDYPTFAEYGMVGTQRVQTCVLKDFGANDYICGESFFDGLGRTIRSESAGPDDKTIITETEYNDRGQVWKEYLPYFSIDAKGDFTKYDYDAIGRVAKVIFPDLEEARTFYEKGVITYVDPNGHVKDEVKDIYGRLIEVREFTGTYPDEALYAKTLYAYDPLGNLEYVRDDQGNETYITYNSLSRKTAIYDPDMGLWEYEYDVTGNLIEQIDAKDQTLYFQYDELNRILQKIYPDNKTIDYQYDEYDNGLSTNAIGRLVELNDLAGTTVYYYNELGSTKKTEKTIDDVTYVTETDYDAMGRTKSLTYPDDLQNPTVIKYVYGSGGELVKVTDEVGITEYVEYSGFNAMGQIGQIAYGNGMITKYTYYDGANENRRLKKILTEIADATTQYIELEYFYDNVGNITQINDKVDSTKSRKYVYDDLDRLIEADSEVVQGEKGVYGGKLLYQYDTVGNMTYNCRYGTYFYEDVNHPHAVTRIEHNSEDVGVYTYDENGNITSGAGRTFEYDYDNRAESIIYGNNTVASVYDASGQRVKKMATVGTVYSETTYIGDIMECKDDLCDKFVFAGSDRVAKIDSNDNTFYYHSDHLGSSTVITDSNPSIDENQQKTFYYPYGEIYDDTGAMIDKNHKFTDQEWDAETGLYYYGARYYDPKLARFISADTIVPNFADPQTLNRYSYVRNNPVVYVDPSGHFFLIDDIIIAVASYVAANAAVIAQGAAWGAALGATSSAIQGGNILQGALLGAVSGAVFTGVGNLVGDVIGQIGVPGGMGPVNPNSAWGVASSIGSAAAGGAAAGATTAAITGEDIGKGALQGGLSAGLGAGIKKITSFLVTDFFKRTSKIGEGDSDRVNNALRLADNKHVDVTNDAGPQYTFKQRFSCDICSAKAIGGAVLGLAGGALLFTPFAPIGWGLLGAAGGLAPWATYETITDNTQAAQERIRYIEEEGIKHLEEELRRNDKHKRRH